MDEIKVGQVLQCKFPSQTVILRIDEIVITPGIAKEIDQRNFAVMVLVTRWYLSKDAPFGTDPHVLNVYLDTLLYWLTGSPDGSAPWEVLEGAEASKYLNYRAA